MAWALANPLKQKVMNLLLNSQALSAKALQQSESIFRPFYEQLAGVKRGEFMPGLGLITSRKSGSLINACIADAMARELKEQGPGKTHCHRLRDLLARRRAVMSLFAHRND